MRYFHIASILIAVLFTSCRSYPQRFTPVEKTAVRYTPAFLDSNDFEHSFKANIHAYGHTLGGIFVIKKIKQHNYRMALLNEFGGTLLGFELLDGKFKLHHAIPPLKRKALLRILEQDFKLLFHEDIPVVRQFAYADTLVYETSLDGKAVYQHFATNGELAKTVLTNRGRERVSITYEHRSPAFPDITLSHRHGKLNIFLFLLKEEHPTGEKSSH